MANLTHLIADHIPKLDPPEVQLRDAMRNSGQTPPETVVMDGQLQRYDDEKENGDALWYIAFNDNIPGGCFGSFRTGSHINWRGVTGRTYSALEEMTFLKAIQDAKEKAETDKRIKNELAADNAVEIFEKLSLATADHPYLEVKQVGPHSARVNGRGDLVIPMTDLEGNITSLQTIFANGEKLFMKGGKVSGSMLNFGARGDVVYVAEGFATAATIYEETGTWTVAAFSAPNITPVVEVLRREYPALDIIVVADNDKNNAGKIAADNASSKFGARVIMPPEVGMDANDFKISGGDLHSLLIPSDEEWLIDGDAFTKQPAPIRWMVKKWLQCDSLIMVHGASGSGKTFVVLDMCLSMAAEFEAWRGFKVRPCPVVYLAGEGHHGVKSRMAAWKSHNGFSGSLKKIHISKSGCDLNTPHGLQKVLSSIRRLPEMPGLVVVDTLHRFLSGDENSAMDAKTMLDACAIIQQEFKCSVLLVHHTGVSEEAQHRGRGSSAWKGALEIEINIQNKDGCIVIAQKKSKDSEMAEDLFCELQSVEVPGWLDEDGEPVTSAVVVDGVAPAKKEAPDKAWKAFSDAFWSAGEKTEDGPYLSKSAWEKALVTISGISEGSARKYVQTGFENGFAAKLIASGKIKSHKNGFLVIDPVLSSALSC